MRLEKKVFEDRTHCDTCKYINSLLWRVVESENCFVTICSSTQHIPHSNVEMVGIHHTHIIAANKHSHCTWILQRLVCSGIVGDLIILRAFSFDPCQHYLNEWLRVGRMNWARRVHMISKHQATTPGYVEFTVDIVCVYIVVVCMRFSLEPSFDLEQRTAARAARKYACTCAETATRRRDCCFFNRGLCSWIRSLRLFDEMCFVLWVLCSQRWSHQFGCRRNPSCGRNHASLTVVFHYNAHKILESLRVYFSEISALNHHEMEF